MRALGAEHVSLDKTAWREAKVPHYLVAGANPPRDRGKRGVKKTRFSNPTFVRNQSLSRLIEKKPKKETKKK